MKVSRILAAFVIFAAINVALSRPSAASLKNSSANTTASMSKDAIQKALLQARDKLVTDNAQAAPVVFIGSSLIIAPLWSTDVKHGYFYQDCMLHHQSQTFQNTLKSEGLTAPVVSLATAGQFVSDTYLIIDKFIANNKSAPNSKKPLALIYGVAPRDFMDDTTGGLALTSVFDELVEVSDLPRYGHLFFNTFDEQADFLLNRSVYLYRKRGRYQTKVKDGAEKLVARAYKDKSSTPGAAGGNLGGSNNDPLAGFLLAGNRSDIWSKSIDEYSKRYKFFNKQQFSKQKECFQQVVSLCQTNNIKLYVVAMPITHDNLKLMPAQLYSSYIDCLATTSKEAGVPFLDLQKSGSYKDADFYDTVHLNGNGGDRFLADMAKFILPETQLATKRPSSPTY